MMMLKSASNTFHPNSLVSKSSLPPTHVASKTKLSSPPRLHPHPENLLSSGPSRTAPSANSRPLLIPLISSKSSRLTKHASPRQHPPSHISLPIRPPPPIHLQNRKSPSIPPPDLDPLLLLTSSLLYFPSNLSPLTLIYPQIKMLATYAIR